jgi:hypothetical protein
MTSLIVYRRDPEENEFVYLNSFNSADYAELFNYINKVQNQIKIEKIPRENFIEPRGYHGWKVIKND